MDNIYSNNMNNNINNQLIEPATMIRLDSIDSFKIINPNVDETQAITNNNDIISDLTIVNINMDPDNIYYYLMKFMKQFLIIINYLEIPIQMFLNQI